MVNSQLSEIPLQGLSQDTWQSKYRLTDKNGTPLDEDLDATYRRVARAIAEVEPDSQSRTQWAARFYWALKHGAIPAGRILSNAGAGEHKPATSTINCTVSGTIEDSMESILDHVKQAGLTLRAGCGVGYEFSTLRPKGAFVAGAGASTSGPLSFMDIYDRMCATISSAGGRRGAQMGTFDVGHPDVLDFIRAKREDGRLRQFNLSLLITDEFVAAVKADAEWKLAFPVMIKELDGHEDLDDETKYVWRHWPVTGRYLKREDGTVCCKVYKTLPARQIWDQIMTSTYEYAEPGFILIDRSNEMNNNWWCENIRASNPCVTADTWVHTSEGPRQVGNLIGRQFGVRLDGEDHLSGLDGFFPTGRKSVVRLTTQEGYSLRLTADHKVRRARTGSQWTGQTEWCPAGELLPGDRVLLNNHRKNPSWEGEFSFSEGYLIGYLIGDGTLLEDTAILPVWCLQQAAVGDDSDGGAAGMSRMEAVRAAAQEALSLSRTHQGWTAVKRSGRSGSPTEYRFQSAALCRLAGRLGLSRGRKVITPLVERASSEFYRGMLRGLFDTDGSVQGSQQKGVSVRLSQSDRSLLEAVQRMLLRLGVTSTIYKRREAGTSVLPDGRGGRKAYDTKEQFGLMISKDNLSVFRDRIGFSDCAKAARLDEALQQYRRILNRERFFATVERVDADGEETVYDVQVPGVNAFDANGLHAHNCGEQMLPPNGACLLGSINLTQFVIDPFTPQARFDSATFAEVVRVFTRMLDNVVEINGLPLPEQREEIRRKRRHGMGYLGLGSALAMLGVRYGSPEAVEFTEKVTMQMAIAGWEEALALSDEKGPAPIMTEEFTITTEMLKQRPEMAQDGFKVGDKVPGRVLHARYSRYMQRLATAAPDLVRRLEERGARFTHATSIAPTGTIALSVGNNVSNGIEPTFAHRYFRNVIKEGKKTKERSEVVSFELLAYRHLVNANASPDAERDEDRLPPAFVATDDITPEQHVAMQAAAQKWVDSSISKTVNVPTDIPFERFKDLYLFAHEMGLKGCTTFRFNPAAFQGVLVKEKDLKETIYVFKTESGEVVRARGDELVEYDGETHTAANLFDALKEGTYGRYA